MFFQFLVQVIGKEKFKRLVLILYQVKEMEEKLIKLCEGVILVRLEDKKVVEDMYFDKINQWRKRKRMFRDVWDIVIENFFRDIKEFKVKSLYNYVRISFFF